jgi:hypothetical protein
MARQHQHECWKALPACARLEVAAASVDGIGRWLFGIHGKF